MDAFNPFSFAGRIGRLQYFGFAVIWALIILVVGGVVVFGTTTSVGVRVGGSLTLFTLSVVYTSATLSYGVRRLHDLDKSGWWYLLSFVPCANAVMDLVLAVAPGTIGGNR